MDESPPPRSASRTASDHSTRPSPQRFVVPKHGRGPHKFKVPEARHGRTDSANTQGVPRAPPRFTDSQFPAERVISPSVPRPRFDVHGAVRHEAQSEDHKNHGGSDGHDDKRIRFLDNDHSYQSIKPDRVSGPRFLDSPGRTDSPTNPSSKPHFLKSSTTSPAMSMVDPLPDVFSPHRRRQQRFVTGGMAAELQSWVTEVGSDTLQARENQLIVGAPEKRTTIKVNAVDGDEVLFISGTGDQGEAIHAALVVSSDPSGAAAQAKRLNLMPGTRVAIRDPMWSLDLPSEEHPLLFGVDWHTV